MKKLVLEQVFHPLALRAGSVLAGALVGVGLAAQSEASVANAVTVVLLLCVDLVSRKMWPSK